MLRRILLEFQDLQVLTETDSAYATEKSYDFYIITCM